MTQELFDKNGDSTDNESGVCAKVVTRTTDSTILGPESSMKQYFVKHCGQLYDPVQMTAVDERNRNWKLRRVTFDVFNTYLNFLKTKKEHYRIHAERLINGQS